MITLKKIISLVIIGTTLCAPLALASRRSAMPECGNWHFADNLCLTIKKAYDKTISEAKVLKQDKKAHLQIAIDIINRLTGGKQNCWPELIACARSFTEKDTIRLFLTQAIANLISRGPIFDAKNPNLASLELLDDSVDRSMLHELVIRNSNTLDRDKTLLLPIVDQRTDILGMTALHYAVVLNKPKLVPFLLRWGVNVSIRTNFPNCQTAYELAKRLNRKEIIETLELFTKPESSHSTDSYLCKAKAFANLFAAKAANLFNFDSTQEAQDFPEL